MGSEVAGFKGRSGDLVWKNELESDSSDATISYVHSTEQTVHVVSSEGEKLYIHKLDASNGAVQKKVGLPALWMKTGSTAVSSSCAMVGREVAVCLDVEGQSLYHSSGERFLLSRLEVCRYCIPENFCCEKFRESFDKGYRDKVLRNVCIMCMHTEYFVDLLFASDRNA